MEINVASEHTYETNVAAKMDYPEHEKTYSGFLAATKWGSIIVVVILIGMGIFLL